MREGRLIRAHISYFTVMSYMRAMLCLLALVTVVLLPRRGAAAPVAVGFFEGVCRGFLVLHTVNGDLIASGALLQVRRGAEAESRMVLRFKDGAVSAETVGFTQQRVFTMQRYRLPRRR